MVYTYRPSGVCSQLMKVELENGIIRNVEILGGCSGNLQGISRLITGMSARDAMSRLQGIRCGFKKTSCPDQLSKALEQALEKEGN